MRYGQKIFQNMIHIRVNISSKWKTICLRLKHGFCTWIIVNDEINDHNGLPNPIIRHLPYLKLMIKLFPEYTRIFQPSIDLLLQQMNK